MRVLAIHNYYQQRGGEDQCFEDEVLALLDHGHQVLTHTVHNDSIDGRSQLSVAVQSVWNRTAARQVDQTIRSFRPDVVHVMNTFPLLSPSVARAAKRRHVPIVFEVQNYRLACAGGVMLRDGNICEKCLTRRIPLPAIQHRCYRGSFSGSLSLATSIGLHRALGTWTRNCDLFLCPSKISKAKLIEAGFPAERIRIKANALSVDPGTGTGQGDYIVFVGRLSPEKGLSTLLDAWKNNPGLPKLKLIGDGPQAELVKSYAQHDRRIECLGKMALTDLLEIVGCAKFLVMPSIWYEPFGRTTIESLAKGTPVIGSRIGATAEIITDGADGLLFKPGDSEDLARQILAGYSLSEAKLRQMRESARHSFLQRYTSQINYQALMQIYAEAIDLGSRQPSGNTIQSAEARY